MICLLNIYIKAFFPIFKYLETLIMNNNHLGNDLGKFQLNLQLPIKKITKLNKTSHYLEEKYSPLHLFDQLLSLF